MCACPQGLFCLLSGFLETLLGTLASILDSGARHYGMLMRAADGSEPQIMSLKVDSWLRHALWTLPKSSSFHLVFCEIREGSRRPRGLKATGKPRFCRLLSEAWEGQSVYLKGCEHRGPVPFL